MGYFLWLVLLTSIELKVRILFYQQTVISLDRILHVYVAAVKSSYGQGEQREPVL